MLICLLVVQELLICDISNSYYRQYSQPKPHTPSAKEKSKRKKPPKNPKQNKTNTHSHKEINVDNVFTKLLCLFKFQMNVASLKLPTAEGFEDTKVVIRIYKSKDRNHNRHNKKNMWQTT
jgi:hypothetical protein